MAGGSRREQIKSATEALFSPESCPMVDAVIARDFLMPNEAARLYARLKPGSNDAHNISVSYEHIPELRFLDTAVASYNRVHCPEGYTTQEGLSLARLMRFSDGFSAHTDGPFDSDNRETHTLDGPVTASLRLDPLPIERKWYLRSWRGHNLGSVRNGILDDDFINNEPNRRLAIRVLGRFGLPLLPGAVSISQKIGDLIIFRNHPFPVQHGVLAKGPTRSLVVGYHYTGGGSRQGELEKIRIAEWNRFPRGLRWGSDRLED